MSKVNKVKLLSERTYGVPPVFFIGVGLLYIYIFSFSESPDNGTQRKQISVSQHYPQTIIRLDHIRWLIIESHFHLIKLLWIFLFVVEHNAETKKMCQYCSYIYVFCPDPGAIGRNNISIICNIEKTPIISVVFSGKTSDLQKPI